LLTSGCLRCRALWFSHPAAIAAAVERWLSWRVDRGMARQTGIPQELPYLLGLVGDCEIEAEISLAP
jgi:hypothetical protein